MTNRNIQTLKPREKRRRKSGKVDSREMKRNCRSRRRRAVLVEKWRPAAIFSACVLVSLFTVPSFSASALSLSLSRSPFLHLTLFQLVPRLTLLFSFTLPTFLSHFFFSLPPSPIYIPSLPPFLFFCPPQPLTCTHISLSSDGMRSADAVG